MNNSNKYSQGLQKYTNNAEYNDEIKYKNKQK